MATYVNDLRLKEIATGDESGTWGTSTNTNLELIAEAFSFGTEAITTNADTHTTTIADGSTDPGRSLYLKYTGTLDSACTITIGPNTVSKLWFIENGTSGSQNIIISQGSGANITIPPGDVKAVYSDGAGSGAAVVDAFASLNVVDLKVQDDLTVTDDATVGGTLGVTGILTCTDDIIIGDGKTIGSASDVDAMTIASNGQVTFTQTLIGTALDISGDIDVDGTTNLDVVDIDGAVDMASTLQVDGSITSSASLDVTSSASDAVFLRSSESTTTNVYITNTNATAGNTANLFFAPANNVSGSQISSIAIEDFSSSANRTADLAFSTRKDGTMAERMRIDSSGRLLVGSTTAVANTGGTGSLQVLGTGNSDTTFTIGRFSANASPGTLAFTKSRNGTIGGNTIVQDDDNLGQIIFTASDGTDMLSVGAKIEAEVDGTPGSNDLPTRLCFFTAADGSDGATERMRIDSSGHILLGTTTNQGVGGLSFQETATGVNIQQNMDGTSGGAELYVFRRNSSQIGSINQSSTNAVTYNTSSDARLKDVTGSSRGLDVINNLNPVAYNWKADNHADEGLIAQEVEQLVPNAINKDEDGFYSMDYSKLVTHLVKGMQEQQEQIESLKSEIANLKEN